MSLVRQAVKFALAGLANTAVGVAAIFVLLAAGANYLVANILGYGVGLLLSYFLNRTWTFAYKEQGLGSFVRFLFLFAACFVANLAIVSALVIFFGVNKYLAQIPGIAVYALLMFVGSKTLVFGKVSTNRHVASDPADEAGRL